MATNVVHRGDPLVALPLAVPASTPAGAIVPIGDEGLMGLTLTTRATTALIAEGKAAPGLADGQASVLLLGVNIVANLEVESTTSVTLGQAVYVDSAGVITDDPTDGPFVGWALATILDEATGPVALATSALATAAS